MLRSHSSFDDFLLVVYSKPLEKDVKSDTSGDFRRLLVDLMQGKRPETIDVNLDQVKKDAQALIDAGPAKFGTEQPLFNRLVCERSDAELKSIVKKYDELSGKSLGKTQGFSPSLSRIDVDWF